MMPDLPERQNPSFALHLSNDFLLWSKDGNDPLSGATIDVTISSGVNAWLSLHSATRFQPWRMGKLL
jgi:hypothetical protein